MAGLFGESRNLTTDLTHIRTKAAKPSVQPVILALGQIDVPSSKETDYGFHYAKLPEIVVEPDTTGKDVKLSRDLEWKVGGKKYSGRVNLVVGFSKESLIPEGEAPRYEELWKDNQLTGMVVVGSNLQDYGPTLLADYLRYYRENDFEFGDEVEVVDDMVAHLRDSVRKGELDYFVKEAHSDGDEKNLFRLAKKAEIYTGTRPLPNGRKEVIQLVYPSEEASPSALLSNQDFGAWLRSRKEAGHGQFVYFNGSCWSKTKAIREIEAARTPIFLNIPTTTITRTFQAHPSNAMYQLIEGFREGKTYSQIRQGMRANEAYKDGKENVFIWPDERAYDEIRAIVKVPVDVEVSISDERGKPVLIDSH